MGSTNLSNSGVRFKRKYLLAARVAFLVLAAVALSSAPAFAAENQYDVLSKMLIPFERLFAREAGHTRPAMVADVALDSMTNASAVTPGSVFHVAFQSPDKLFLSGTVLAKPITACRNGKDIWAVPGAQIAMMLGPNSGTPTEAPKFILNDMVLPIPQKQLVFLPILFQVTDVGDEVVGADSCRILDVTLMPQIAASLKVTGWTARVWVKPDYTPAKVDLSKPGWHIAVDVQKLAFVPTLPASTWEPTPAMGGDVVHLTAAQLVQLAGLAGLKVDN